MLCVIPFHSGDVKLAQDLLLWIRQLGGCAGHDCLLVPDAAVPWTEGKATFESARQSFATVKVVTNAQSIKGWIPGSNDLFRCAAQFANGRPFLWIEPDAVPLKPGWLDQIEAAYRSSGKLFLGSLVKHAEPGWPNPYLEGCAVYPPDCWMRFRSSWNPAVSWTRATAQASVRNAADSPLFQHLWGETKRPPVFAEKGTRGTNVFGLDSIQPDAVLYHRCKDGSLTRLLRRRNGVKEEDLPPEQHLLTVFAFCRRDEALMLKTMLWMEQLCGRIPRKAILHFDAGITRASLSTIHAAANRVFDQVEALSYPTPRRPWTGWPGACNWSFKEACRIMPKYGKPWLWYEPDMVPIAPHWYKALEKEYYIGGKPFMGHIVRPFDGWEAGHMNGTGVYPFDAGRYIQKALSVPTYPWDAGMKPEMRDYCHEANHLIQHCGGVKDGCCKPASAPVPEFPDQETVYRLINPRSVVLFHPDKKGTLIDRLRQQPYDPAYPSNPELLHPDRHPPEGLPLAPVVPAVH